MAAVLYYPCPTYNLKHYSNELLSRTSNFSNKIDKDFNVRERQQHINSPRGVISRSESARAGRHSKPREHLCNGDVSDPGKAVSLLLTLLLSARPSKRQKSDQEGHVNDLSTDTSMATAPPRPPLWTELTVHKLINMITIFAFCLEKDLLTYEGLTIEPTTLDLVSEMLGVV